MAQINVNMIVDQMNDFSSNLMLIENQLILMVDTAKKMIKDLYEGFNLIYYFCVNYNLNF